MPARNMRPRRDDGAAGRYHDIGAVSSSGDGGSSSSAIATTTTDGTSWRHQRRRRRASPDPTTSSDSSSRGAKQRNGRRKQQLLLRQLCLLTWSSVTLYLSLCRDPSEWTAAAFSHANAPRWWPSSSTCRRGMSGRRERRHMDRGRRIPIGPLHLAATAATTTDAAVDGSTGIETSSTTAATTELTLGHADRPPVHTRTKPMPILGYDAASIIDFYDRRPWEVGWRLNALGLPLLGWYFGLLTDRLMGINEQESVQRKRGEELRMHLVRSGSVALVKSGQALSLRPDLLRNKIWAEELGKLVDAVGSFSDAEAMDIMRDELSDMMPQLKAAGISKKIKLPKKKGRRRLTKLESKVQSDPVLSLFEFYNDNRAVASASIGQVYKARMRRGAQLEAAIGKKEAAIWGGKTVAIKVQRPDAFASASLDMYLLRRTAMWLSKFRGGDLPAVADQFGMQLFGELDYVREANNCDRFRELYGGWDEVVVPPACNALTRKKVLVMEWIDGEKGPWVGPLGIDMVRIGLRCSTDQLLHTGLFHADPHRGNLLKTPNGKLAFIDFGMMADVSEDERYGLIGLIIGLQNKDLPLTTENLLKLGFLEDTTQLDLLIPRLRTAVINSTGGTGKTSDINFSQLQGELDAISRDNVLKFKTPPFFTIIIRSLTILEGFALSVDPNFKLIRGAYPYVLKELVSPDGDERTPEALRKLLVRLLTVNGEEQEVEWGRLRDFLRLAEKATSKYNASLEDEEDKKRLSRQTIDLFVKFLTSRTGLFLKKPLVHELAEAIDGMASIGEANLLQLSRGIIRPLPGGNGPVNNRRMEELSAVLDVVQSALVVQGDAAERGRERMESMSFLLQELVTLLSDDRRREELSPVIAEISSVFQMVAVEVLEIRGSRAMRSILRLNS